MNKEGQLTHLLEMTTDERNELHGILAHSTNNDLNNGLNFALEVVNMDHKKVMPDLRKFPKEMNEALDKCKELIEETISCSILHSSLLNEWTQLKTKVNVLRQDNRKLWREQTVLQESCEEAKKLCKEAGKMMYDLWDRQMQKQERLEERLQYLLRQRDLVSEQKDLAESLQHHFTVS